MNENGTNRPGPAPAGGPGEDRIESLLRSASSRPTPSDEDRAQVLAAVKDEWTSSVSKRRRQRRMFGFSIAASLLLVSAVVYLNQAAPPENPELEQVAHVDRISGRVRIFSEIPRQSGSEPGLQTPVFAGQVVTTGPESGIALTLNQGISVRVDEATEIEVVRGDSIRLNTGRVYVDTRPEGLNRSHSGSQSHSVEIVTDQGIVRHLGTQFMVISNQDSVDVSVREGQVQLVFDSAENPEISVVGIGMSLSMNNQGETVTAPINVFGSEWMWAENLGPGFVLDDRSIAEFLEWVARETGLMLHYESMEAQTIASEAILHGVVDLPAQEALHLVLQSTDLTAEIREGMILIRHKD